MSASNITATLTLLQTDSIGATLLNRTIQTVFAGAVGDFFVGNLPNTSLTAITVPASPVLQLYVKNLQPTTGNLTVTWTPTTGASAVAIVLGPLAWIAFQFPTTAASYGISALSLTASVSNTPYELFLGA